MKQHWRWNEPPVPEDRAPIGALGCALWAGAAFVAAVVIYFILTKTPMP